MYCQRNYVKRISQGLFFDYQQNYFWRNSQFLILFGIVTIFILNSIAVSSYVYATACNRTYKAIVNVYIFWDSQ